jgi:hypothetical protein
MSRSVYDGIISPADELQHKYADAYNNRGIAKKKFGDLTSAISDCTLNRHP